MSIPLLSERSNYTSDVVKSLKNASKEGGLFVFFGKDGRPPGFESFVQEVLLSSTLPMIVYSEGAAAKVPDFKNGYQIIHHLDAQNDSFFRKLYGPPTEASDKVVCINFAGLSPLSTPDDLRRAIIAAEAGETVVVYASANNSLDAILHLDGESLLIPSTDVEQRPRDRLVEVLKAIVIEEDDNVVSFVRGDGCRDYFRTILDNSLRLGSDFDSRIQDILDFEESSFARRSSAGRSSAEANKLPDVEKLIRVIIGHGMGGLTYNKIGKLRAECDRLFAGALLVASMREDRPFSAPETSLESRCKIRKAVLSLFYNDISQPQTEEPEPACVSTVEAPAVHMPGTNDDIIPEEDYCPADEPPSAHAERPQAPEQPDADPTHASQSEPGSFETICGLWKRDPATLERVAREQARSLHGLDLVKENPEVKEAVSHVFGFVGHLFGKFGDPAARQAVMKGADEGSSQEK